MFGSGSNLALILTKSTKNLKKILKLQRFSSKFKEMKKSLRKFFIINKLQKF